MFTCGASITTLLFSSLRQIARVPYALSYEVLSHLSSSSKACSHDSLCLRLIKLACPCSRAIQSANLALKWRIALAFVDLRTFKPLSMHSQASKEYLLENCYRGMSFPCLWRTSRIIMLIKMTNLFALLLLFKQEYTFKMSHQYFPKVPNSQLDGNSSQGIDQSIQSPLSKAHHHISESSVLTTHK